MSFEREANKVPMGPGHPAYERAKNEINEGGFEGDEEGGADVFVGKKEDVERMRKQGENEGRTETLDSFIRLHGSVVAPKEFAKEYLEKLGINFENLKPGDYGIDKLGGQNVSRMWFVDRNLDLKQVTIDTEKITEINDPHRVRQFLDRLGFSEGSSVLTNKLFDCIMAYREKLAKEESVAGKKEFDF